MKKLLCLIFFLVFLPISALADDPIVGKWSFFWDARSDHAEESMGAYLISIDLIFSENHFTSLIMAHIGPNDKNFVIDEPIKGGWMSNGDNTYKLVMVYDDPIHSMTLKEDGRLYVQMSENEIIPFTKTENYSMYSEATP